MVSRNFWKNSTGASTIIPKYKPTRLRPIGKKSKKLPVAPGIVTRISTGCPERTDQGRKEMFYLTTHSTHFIYVYMASDIW